VRRVADQRGIALSSPVALHSAAAVVVAGAAFLATGNERPEPEVARTVTATPSVPAPTTRAPGPVIKEKKHQAKKPPVRRAGTYVEVYNNSGISGLAGRTARRASGAGWKVTGSDNWYGTIAASTVYYPAKLKAAAKLIALDLGLHRVVPAAGGMHRDRLTVILTADAA
jgi:hypothetical protein